MARVTHREPFVDARGAVYVEFLIAFMPVFVLFLATCQLALLMTAKVAVRQAAFAAVRSAIVVLEEPSAEHDGAALGSLSDRPASSTPTMEALVSAIENAIGGTAPAGSSGTTPRIAKKQGGVRMVPIRTAAYVSLLPLSPRFRDLIRSGASSIASSLPSGAGSDAAFAIAYAQAASAVTIQEGPGDGMLAQEPVGPAAAVTIRVTYLYRCSVPLASVLMCRSLESLVGAHEGSLLGIPLPPAKAPVGKRLDLAEAPELLAQIAAKGTRFVAVEAEATLPNQGASYYSRGKAAG